MKKRYFALAASSIDGKIALHENHFTDWTSKEDYAHLQHMLADSDCILVGNNTYKVAEKPLSKRNCVVLSRKYTVGIQYEKSNLCFCNPAYIDIKTYFEQSTWNTICILGGTQTYHLALQKQMIEEIYLTIEPILFTQGLNLFDSPIIEDNHFSEYIQCTLQNYTKLNTRGTLLLQYTIDYQSKR